MDPVSLSTSAAYLITICAQDYHLCSRLPFVLKITICAQAVRILKQTIETISDAKSCLLRLLSQIERLRIFLEQLHALTKKLGSRAGMLLNFNDSGPRDTINELHAFVQNVAQNPMWIRVKVLLHKSTADKFVQRLCRHEEEIMQTLLSVTTSATIRTEDEIIRQMREDAILHSRVIAPFSSEAPVAVDTPDFETDKLRLRLAGLRVSAVGPADDWESPRVTREKPAVESISLLSTSETQTLYEERDDENRVSRFPEDTLDLAQKHVSKPAIPEVDLFSSEEDIEEEQLSKLQVWFGDLSRVGFDMTYLALRDNLSDAAYYGSFEELFHKLAGVESVYAQSWANAPRLSETPQQASGWTLLHQAVFMGASKADITRLVRDYGALRLLRTAWKDESELPNRKMTAVEIAMAIGRWEVVDVLIPGILYSAPHYILAFLQSHFQGLIRSNLQSRPLELALLRLPDLLVLTELELPIMWFPLKSEGSTQRTQTNLENSASDNRRRVRGYLYRLDGEELLVKSFNIEREMTKLYRISRFGLHEIENAIAFHV